MGGDALGAAVVAPEPAQAAAPAWDRFAHWPKGAARLMLAAVLAVLVASALVPIRAGSNDKGAASFAENLSQPKAKQRDLDLALYDRVIARIRHGERYYDVIAQEHRRADFPLRPGLAVRLPTLVYLDAWLGDAGQMAAATLLMLAVVWAWWRRLRDEPGGPEHMRLALALCLVGASLGVNRYFFTLHELWSGMLLALAFALHRPGARWGAALAVAALALAIREHALPFVLLMAAMAFWRRDWKEGAAWSALAAAFLAGLAIHLHVVSGLVVPGDGTSAPWLVMRGLSGWLSNIVLSSNLRLLPHWLAGPMVMAMMVGWMGWKSPAGVFGTLLFGGYGLLFMLAGRGDNYYWGAMVAPAMMIGLAFAPRFFASLARSAVAK